MKYKKLILIDLDGVLNKYDGNFDKNFIPDINEGTIDFLEILSKDYRLRLFTTRDKNLAEHWVSDNKLDQYIESVTNIKEPCYLHIDDRCINFQGDFEKILDEINDFTPWYRKQ